MPLSPEDELIWREAYSRLPLKTLIERLGDSTHLKGSVGCPFCREKHKFGVFERGARWYFKCHNPDCPANETEHHDEIAYLGLRRNLDRKTAALEYLRLAVPELLRENQPTPDEPNTAPPVADWRTAETQSAWHALAKLLRLTAADHAKIQRERGLSDEIIRECAFLTNDEHNREAVESLREQFDIELLISLGIFKQERFKDPRPAGQLLGWGVRERDWTNPPLIPYFGADGIPFLLRPHKGMIKRPEDPFADIDVDDPEERSCAANVYVPPGTGELIAKNDGLCVMTEGEFKSAAGKQCAIPIMAVPGISFIKNAYFRRQLLGIVEELGITDLVIIFDNEAKDDPQFSNFKQDPFDRFDVQVWAEYAQRILSPTFNRLNGSCRIGWLPDDLREKGKADFDSILARFVRADGMKKGTQDARRVFLRTIADARAPMAFRELFPSPSRRIIEWKLERKFYTPMLFIGGEKESALADRFGQFDEGKPIDKELADAYRSVIGCYWKRSSVDKGTRGHLIRALKDLNEHLATVKADAKSPDDPRLRVLTTKRAAIYEKLRGVPERLSTFTLHCEYRLHGADKNVIRLVKIKDSKDLRRKDHDLRRLTKSDLAGLRNFREWLLGTGEGVWHGGEKDLQNLCEDLDHQAYMRDIHEVIRIGYDDNSRIWFAGDEAIGPDGESIYPDDKGIFWKDGVGYQINTELDERGSIGFVQGVPYWSKPQDGGKALTPLELAARFGGKPPPGRNLPSDPLTCGVRGLLKRIAEDLFDNIGGYDAWLGLGLMLAYGIAPEMVRMTGHPGPWFSGKRSEGKSTMIRWLMRIWGFRHLEGIMLNETLTQNALIRIMAQYSCLPVFLDEARRLTLTEEKLSCIRGAFQRQGPAKATADYTLRVRDIPPHTSPVVGGESNTDDSATFTRFGQVQVSASRRIGDGPRRRDRIDDECPHYYHIGRWILTHRPQFLQTAMEFLSFWTEAEKVRTAMPDYRLRFVHGVAFACMQAACHMLELHEWKDEHGKLRQFEASPESNDTDMRPRTMSGFFDFLLTHGQQALQDAHDSTFLNQFWTDLISGRSLNKIPEKCFILAHLTRKAGSYSIKRYKANEEPPAGSFLVCFIVHQDAFAAYEAFYRSKASERTPLSLSGVRKELEREPYWVPPPEGRKHHRPKFEGGKPNCWCISLDTIAKPAMSDNDGAGDPDIDEPDYIFPHATALLQAIGQSSVEDEER